jgi:hypothetical protein
VSHGSVLSTCVCVLVTVVAGGQPLFAEDVWAPAADGHNTWVSVGNYDPAARLGRTHTELFGEPGWGESTDALPHRVWLAAVAKA